MIKALKNRKAEGYIDVAIAVLVIVFLLVLALSVFKLVTLKQDMKYMCEELVKTATLNGKVGDEVDERFEELCAETGVFCRRQLYRKCKPNALRSLAMLTQLV